MNRKLGIVDVFSGCGGFALGAELAGMKSLVAVDIDPNLQSSYAINFPESRPILADVASLDRSAWRLLLKGQRPDGVIGGPPCQGFSRIGKRNKADPRNSLISSFFDQVEMLDPNFFVLENVEGLLDEGTKDVLTTAMEKVAGRFNVLDPVVVNAADFGAPTTRKRVLVIGYNPSYVDRLAAKDILPGADGVKVSVKDAIWDLKGPRKRKKNEEGFVYQSYRSVKDETLSEYATWARTLPPAGLGDNDVLSALKAGLVTGFETTVHTERVVERFKNTVPGKVEAISRYPKLSWSGQCPTLRAGTGSDRGSFQAMRPIHPRNPRVITVREAARLQGFPDWFQFHPTKWHSFRMIGNSVSPLMSKFIMTRIRGKLSNYKAA